MPNAAITSPPSAGPPSRNASVWKVKSAEFACRSSSSGTSCGTIEPNAGPANALPEAEDDEHRGDVPELESPAEREDADRSRRKRP